MSCVGTEKIKRPQHRQPNQAEIQIIRRLIVIRQIIHFVTTGVAFELRYCNGEWVIVEVATNG